MQTRWQLWCVLFLALPLVRASGGDPPVVTTSQGCIVGTRLKFSPTDPKLGRDVDAYLGIPYAEPPVGPLRLKPPVAKSSWSGELQATKLGNRCPQLKLDMGYLEMTENFAEDCLVLDVFVPQPVVSELSSGWPNLKTKYLHLSIKIVRENSEAYVTDNQYKARGSSAPGRTCEGHFVFR